MTQNIGGIAGSALLGSYQILRAKYHATVLAGDIMASNPVVAGRIQEGAQLLAGVITDPTQRGVQGAGLLGQSLATQAAILGFNDSFRLVMFVALGAALFLAVTGVKINWNAWNERRLAKKGVQ